MINPTMIDAVKVQFLKPIFEDDFAERGMTAWLTGIEWDEKLGCFELFFDFSEFETINEKYFREVYFPNRHTSGYKKMYTALEAGQYNPKYKVYFSVFMDGQEVRNDEQFMTEITEYLKEIA